MFPKGCDRGTISHVVRKRFPGSFNIMTKTVRKMSV